MREDHAKLLAQRDGRDELNLAEWPIALVGKRPASSRIEFRDWVRGKNGERIERCWIIEGGAESGLPTPFCQDAYLALMQISLGNEFADRTILISLREICRALGINESGPNLKRIREALDILASVTIRAKSAFWDKRKGTYVDATFHVIDLVVYPPKEEQNVPQSQVEVTWGQVIWESIRVGALKTLSLSFYTQLNSDVARRLYCYLDKHRWDGKKEYRLSLEKAVTHAGIQASTGAKQKKSLRAAHEELQDKGFLHSARFQKGKEGWIIVYRFAPPVRPDRDETTLQLELLPTEEEFHLEQAWSALKPEEQEALRAEAVESFEGGVQEAARLMVQQNPEHPLILGRMKELLRQRLGGSGGH